MHACSKHSVLGAQTAQANGISTLNRLQEAGKLTSSHLSLQKGLTQKSFDTKSRQISEALTWLTFTLHQGQPPNTTPGQYCHPQCIAMQLYIPPSSCPGQGPSTQSLTYISQPIDSDNSFLNPQIHIDFPERPFNDSGLVLNKHLQLITAIRLDGEVRRKKTKQ